MDAGGNTLVEYPAVAAEVSAPRRIWAVRTAEAFILFVMIAALIFTCSDALLLMWTNWFGAPEYSYAVLIPVIFVFLIWQKAPQLRVCRFVGSWSGVGVAAVGALMYAIGELGSVYYLIDLSFLVTMYGVVLSFLGWRAFRVILIPLLILVFMIPLPAFVNNNLSLDLQLISSDVGVAVIRMFGISVYQEGNVIDLGGYRLQVVEACAGLRYLFPLMTLGALFGYFYKAALWKRVVVFLSSIPIAVVMNSVRIGIIGVLVDQYGTGMAEGFLHDFEGWMVFMICAALMVGEVILLTRIGRDRGNWRERFGVEFPESAPRNSLVEAQRMGAPTATVAALVVALAVLSALAPHRAEAVPSRPTFVEFPATMGEWRGKRNVMDAAYLDQLKLDDYLLSDYTAERRGGHRAGPVSLYVAYYASQRKGEAVHSPRSCLPGGGWVMRDFDQRALPGIFVNGHALRVNRAIIELGTERSMVYYWFQQRGRIVTNEYAIKLLLFWDALARNRTDGALVRLVTALPAGTAESEADARLSSFARVATPVLSRYIPN